MKKLFSPFISENNEISRINQHIKHSQFTDWPKCLFDMDKNFNENIAYELAALALRVKIEVRKSQTVSVVYNSQYGDIFCSSAND